MACADKKRRHVELEGAAQELAATIGTSGRAHDVIVHVTDPSDRAKAVDVAEAARLVRPGEVREEPGCWHVRAEIPLRQPYTLLVAGESYNPPGWWPRDSMEGLVFGAAVPGPDASFAPPQTRLIYTIPLDAYINPVDNKATRPQGSVGDPFVIALDVSNLPGGIIELSRLIPLRIRDWRQVSGVLLFQPRWDSEKSGWVWRLVRNDQAEAPLPANFINGDLPDDQTLYAGFELRSADMIDDRKVPRAQAVTPKAARVTEAPALNQNL